MSNPVRETRDRSFTCAKGRTFRVTYIRLRGSQPGPTLTLIGGQHGMEHIGPVVLKEMIDELAERDFRGTVNVCPCANPLALELDFEYYPEREDLAVLDEYFYSRFRHDYCPYGMERSKGPNYYNMNRLWNRDTLHGVAGHVAAWLWEEIASVANLTVDFHCLQAEKPLIYNWHEAGIPFAASFGIEAIFPHGAPTEFTQGNLGYQSGLRGHYGFCVEFSTQHAYKDEFELGKRGIRNVMAALGMTDDPIVIERPVHVVREVSPVTATALGHIHYARNEYDPVCEGDLLFRVTGLEAPDVLQTATSPINGIVGRRTHNPIARPDAHVISVLKTEKIVEAGGRPDLPVVFTGG